MSSRTLPTSFCWVIFSHKYHMVVMFDAAVFFAIFVLHFVFLFQFRTVFPEMVISFTVKALSTIVCVDTTGE